MYLHEDKELFKDIIIATANDIKLPIEIIEKDYYVTEILRCLSKLEEKCVFKGGTELSKCHKLIDRFSEDIDITFTNKLNRNQRKKLKHNSIASISEKLGMPIIDWNKTRSNRDYNCYTFNYEPIEGYVTQGRLIQGVKMETALGSISFPVEIKEVGSYIYDYLEKENKDIITEYNLDKFSIKVQSIERTFIDKVFAICDYYMRNNINRHSRHLYDLHMLLPHIEMNDNLKELIVEVRKQRNEMNICPSANFDVDINVVLKEIVEKETYKKDYLEITTYFQNKPVNYSTVISSINKIIKSNIFVINNQ